MKNQRNTALFDKGKTMGLRINNFFRLNNYLITILLSLFMLYEIIQNNSFREDAATQWKDEISLLKRNLGKVHFLTASGQHVVGEKQVIMYGDVRFKDYLKNTIVDNTVFGAMKLTKGFKIKFLNPKDILEKTERMKKFENAFFHTDKTLLNFYRQGVYKAIWDARLPEYLEIDSVSMTEYTTSQDKNGYHIMSGKIELVILVKSYIKELSKWDNRKTNIAITFSAYVDINKYAGTDNPFGLNIYKLNVPVIYKPRADSLKD